MIGYHIYRSNEETSEYTRLTDSPVTATTYTDTLPVDASTVYMVRTIKMQETPSGSYTNASQGTYLAQAAQATSSPLTAWQNAVFTNPSVDQALPANPDNDESTNLLEYALGTDPTKYEPLPLTLSATEGTLTYTENVLATDATLICEMSADLKTWIPVAYDSQFFDAIASSVPSTQVRRVTLNLSEIPGARCSFRLRVVMP